MAFSLLSGEKAKQKPNHVLVLYKEHYLDEVSCFDRHGTATVEKKACGSMWATGVEHEASQTHVHGVQRVEQSVLNHLNMP